MYASYLKGPLDFSFHCCPYVLELQQALVTGLVKVNVDQTKLIASPVEQHSIIIFFFVPHQMPDLHVHHPRSCGPYRAKLRVLCKRFV